MVVAKQKLKVGAKSNIRVVQKPLYPEAASDPFITEKWGRTKKAIEAQNVKRKKYTVYSGKQLIKIGKNIIAEEKKKSLKTEKEYAMTKLQDTLPVQYAARKKTENKTKGHRIPNKLTVRGINKIQPNKKKIREKACTKAVLNMEKIEDEFEKNHSIKPATNFISKYHNVGEYNILPNELVTLHYLIFGACKNWYL